MEFRKLNALLAIVIVLGVAPEVVAQKASKAPTKGIQVISQRWEGEGECDANPGFRVSTTLTVDGQTQTEVMAAVAKVAGPALAKFGFTLTKAPKNLAGSLLPGTLVYGADAASLPELMKKISIIGDRTNGHLRVNVTEIYLELIPGDISYSRKGTVLTLGFAVSVIGIEKYETGIYKQFVGFVAPQHQDSSALQVEIVDAIEGRPGKVQAAAVAPKMVIAMSQEQKLKVADAIDQYAKDCRYFFGEEAKIWRDVAKDKGFSKELPGDMQKQFGLDGSWGERSRPEGDWGILLNEATQNLRRGGEPAKSRELIELQASAIRAVYQSITKISVEGGGKLPVGPLGSGMALAGTLCGQILEKKYMPLIALFQPQ